MPAGGYSHSSLLDDEVITHRLYPFHAGGDLAGARLLRRRVDEAAQLVGTTVSRVEAAGLSIGVEMLTGIGVEMLTTPQVEEVAACPGSAQEGPARCGARIKAAGRAARGGCLCAHLGKRGDQLRFLKRQLSLPVSMMSQ